MEKLFKAITPVVLTFILYIVYTGSTRLYDIITGLIVALLVGGIFAPFLIENWRKSLDIRRVLTLIRYLIRYLLIDEVKAHIEVIKLGLSSKIPVKPGIVRVPIQSRSEYAITLLSLSITNTPGTVVIDVDKDKGILYVNWIYVKSIEPSECYKYIAKVFDEYAKKIFD